MADAVELDLDKIRLDGGTQVRVEIDEPTVQRYREIIEDGRTLAPIQVLHDGSDHWPYDGFHRIHAARGAGKKTILAQVEAGTRKDAIRKALSANTKHGKPLTLADRVNAVRIALKEFPDLSDRTIASEIIVSHMTVAKYRSELEAGGQIGHVTTRTGKDGKSYKAPAAAPQKPIDSDKIPFDVPSEPSQPPAPTAAVQPKDEVGNVLVSQKMIEDFGRRGEINKLMQAISEVKTSVDKAVKCQDPLFMGLNSAAFDAGCSNLYRRLSTLKPYAICPYCGGDGCKSCHERGWVGKEVYEAAPKDAK